MFVFRPARPLVVALGVVLLALATTVTSPGVTVAASAPTLSTDVITSSPTTVSVRVTGAGFDVDTTGVYVSLVEQGSSTGIADAWVATDASAAGGIDIGAEGDFTVTLSLDSAKIAALDSTKTYEAFSRKAHGQDGAHPSQRVREAVAIDFSTLVEPEQEPDPEPEVIPDPSVTVSDTSVSAEGSTTVTVQGKNFAPSLATGSRPPLAGKAAGAYVVVGKFAENWEPSTGAGSSTRKVAEQKWAVLADDMATIGGANAGAVELKPDGSFTAELAVSKAAVDALAGLNETHVNYGIYTYPGSGASQAKYETYTPITFQTPGPEPTPPPSPTPKPTTPTKPSSVGSLTWGVKAPFRDYVTGNIAKGSIAVGAGATGSGSSIRFAQTSSSAEAPHGVGRTSYRGTVAFSGHGGALNLRIADPQVRVQSRTSASLVATVNGTRTTFATLNLARAGKTTSGGAISYSRAPATLTAAGARGFNGFYGAGESLDPVSFVIGADGSGGGGGIRTVASSAGEKVFTPPTTPPAATGLELEGGTDDLAPGDVVTAAAGGFEPNETGIAVVVYSTPVVLERSLTADAQGRATWTGPLPMSLEPGEHTMTFQGTVDRGVTFTVVANDASQAGRCTIEYATFTWGVKESFRSYISGSIANGDWSTSGHASYTTPLFTFDSGEGDFDTSESVGEVEFDGLIQFTGHDGALDVKLADPELKFVDADSAILLLDVTSASMDDAMAGDALPTTTEDVPFVELDLSRNKLTIGEDGKVTATGVPTTLTSQGHDVFSNYESGAAFDPIDLTINVTSDCASSVGAEPVSKTAAQATDDSSNAGWWLGGGAAALVLLVAAALVARSGRRGTE